MKIDPLLAAVLEFVSNLVPFWGYQHVGYVLVYVGGRKRKKRCENKAI